MTTPLASAAFTTAQPGPTDASATTDTLATTALTLLQVTLASYATSNPPITGGTITPIRQFTETLRNRYAKLIYVKSAPQTL